MTHRLFLLLLLLAAAQGAVSQNVFLYKLLQNDTLHIYNCHLDNLRVEYPGNLLSGSLHSCLIIETEGVPFSVDVSFLQGNAPNRVHLRIWDGDSATGGLVTSITNLTYAETVAISSGKMTLLMEREDSSDMSMTFSLDFVQDSGATSVCTHDVWGFRVASLTHTSARIQWYSQASAFQVQYGNVTQTVGSHELYLQNLVPDSVYTITVLPMQDIYHPCCARTFSFRTNCPPYIGCPDFTDLHTGSVRGYYGRFGNPYSSVGFVETDSIYSRRHSVHRDTSETDPRTGGQLHTVCPGTRASVQLGNWNAQSEAEALEYFLYIDTSYYALLLLHYAVVLQNPGHSSVEQPRFRMEVLDSVGDVIDPVCGIADFAASDSLGWNSNDWEGLVWKDWTTAGFDMTPYHRQIVRVRFTTYDCAQGAHYGYAYFSAECSLNSASTEYCGETDTNVITAPDGFDYLWYYNNPSDTVSTEQTVTFSNSDAMLHCRLVSKENPTCYVTLNTYAGHRWPQADGGVFSRRSLGCAGYKIQFINNSVVTNNDGDTVEMHCETARWYFGDAFMSFDYNPSHVYHDSGDFTVTLVAGIANNSCLDTFQFTVHVPYFYVPAIKDTFACDTVWFGNVAYTSDGLGPSYSVHPLVGCDTLYTLDMHILHSPLTEIPPDTFCYSSTYWWRGLTAGNPDISDTAYYRLIDRIPTDDFCDSLVALNLVQLPPDHLAITAHPDCSQKRYTLTAVSGLPFLRWASSPPDPMLDGHETDSSVLVMPTNSTIYTLTSDYRDTVYCPTFRDITLRVAAFPEARFTVSPAILSYDYPEFDAHDISNYSFRQWGLQTFPGSGDTLYLAETSAHLHYRLDDYDIDSVRVILAVSDDYCYDTTHLTVPFVRSSIWVPNVFTPSEDANNRFVPVSSGLLATELYIYDRAGRQVFSTQILGQGWDGTHDGRPCPQGTYAWLLRYRSADYPDVWRTTSGTVTLLR